MPDSNRIVALLLLMPLAAWAGANGNGTDHAANGTLAPYEVGGIVTGQTITTAGKAFYDGFAAAWREQDEQGRFTVSISERPSARWGSQVFVDYGQRRLFRTFLPPNRERIRAIAAQAAGLVLQSIIDAQVAQLFGDPDLGRDEF